MLGGSPMRVAVPPMFEAKIWLIRYGNGLTFRVRAIDRVTGVSSTTVVTLSRTAARSAVRIDRMSSSRNGWPREKWMAMPGHVLEEAGLAEAAGQHHHPGQQEDDVEVDRREGLFLVDDPEDHDQQAAEQGDERAVEALGGDQRVGDEEDAAGEEDVHRQPASGARGRAIRRSGVGASRETSSGRAYPPGPSLAATTSDVRPRPTFIVSRASMTSGILHGLRGGVPRCASPMTGEVRTPGRSPRALLQAAALPKDIGLSRPRPLQPRVPRSEGSGASVSANRPINCSVGEPSGQPDVLADDDSWLDNFSCR